MRTTRQINIFKITLIVQKGPNAAGCRDKNSGKPKQKQMNTTGLDKQNVFSGLSSVIFPP